MTVTRRLVQPDRRLTSPDPARTAEAAPACQTFDALAEILFQLPPGPFSRDNLLACAIGLNALKHASEISPMLERLTELGLVRQLVDSDDWVVVKRGEREAADATETSLTEG